MPIISLASIVVAGLNFFFGMVAAPLWLIVLLLLWMHRDPVRKIPSAPLGIVSPVQGNVIYADSHPDPYLGRDAQLIKINMSFASVYSVRAAVEGKLMQQWLDQESEDEHDVAHALHIRTDEQDDVVVVLRPGRLFKNISCNANIGERVGSGHRCGYIRFGTVIDVYLPASARLQVKQGDKVKGGESLLAEFAPH